MAILPVLQFPDPRLRVIAKPVTKVDDSLLRLIDNMFETMYAAPGVGLAAIQVNVHKRLLIVDVSTDQSEPYVFINPKFKPLEGEKEYDEGCLSIPGFYETVTRPDKIWVSALDRNNKIFEMECDGLLSVCIQHEIDHLDGKLFVDYLTKLKRNTIRRKLEKQQRLSSQSTSA